MCRCIHACLMSMAIFAGFSLCQLAAQDAKGPTAAEVKELFAKYQAEKQEVLKRGIAKHFLPVLLDKADELAARAEKALEQGRLFQAREGFRQARWQLPYQSPAVPAEHVARVLGNLRLRHQAEVTAIAFSPDGKLLASASRDQTVRIWDLDNGHELRTYTGHADAVRAVAFSADGKAVVSGGAEKNIRVWDPISGKDIRTIPGDGIYVTALLFSNNGKYLFSGQTAKEINAPNYLCVHEFESGKLIRKIEDFRSPIQTMNFSPDGSTLAVGSGDVRGSVGQIRLWEFPRMVDTITQPDYWSQQDDTGIPYHVSISPDNRTLARCGDTGIKLFKLPLPNDKELVRTPRKIIPPSGPLNPYLCAIFSKDSKTLFAGGADGSIRMFDPDNGNPAGIFKGHATEVRALCFNPMGGQLASASSDHTIRLWDSDVVMQSRDYAGHEGPVWKSSFSSDGKRIVSASADKTVRIWDVAGGKPLVLTGHDSAVAVAIFSPDGKLVASGGGDKVVKIWDAGSGKLLRDLAGHQATITALDFSSDGKKLVSACVDRKLKIWDPESGKELVTIDDNGSIPTCAVFSPDGKQLAVGSVDQSIRLYDPATGKLQTSWSAHGTAVSGIAYSPDGKLLASCGPDQVVRIWTMAKPGSTPIILSGHTGPVSAVAFRRDNLHVASCGADMGVKLWKLEGDVGREVQNYRGHRDWLTSVNFSKDGFYLVSSGVDRIVKTWEITTREIPLLTEHAGGVQAVAVSPDGKLIASGAADTLIKIWDRETGAELATLAGHTEGVSALVFSADNKLLVSAALDRTLKVWDVATGKEVPRQPGQQQNWTNLLSPSPLLALSEDGNTLIIWEPGDPRKAGNERFTKINAYELATGKLLFTFSDAGRQVQAVSFAGDGKSVVIASLEGTMRLFDLTKKGQAMPGGDWFLFDKEATTGDVALSPDGSILAAAGGKGDVKICKVDGREVVKTIQAHAGHITSCLISPDGKRLATFGQDNILKLWDLASGKELRRWSMQTPGDASTTRRGAVQNLIFTPDGRQLITANANTTLFVLDLP